MGDMTQIWFSSDEYEILEMAASVDGAKDLAAWMRKVLLEYAQPIAESVPVEEINEPCNRGDYVLAVSYVEGDPRNPWYVGFYEKSTGQKHILQNVPTRLWASVMKITEAEGTWLLDNSDKIVNSGHSLWHFMRQLRKPGSTLMSDRGASNG